MKRPSPMARTNVARRGAITLLINESRATRWRQHRSVSWDSVTGRKHRIRLARAAHDVAASRCPRSRPNALVKGTARTFYLCTCVIHALSSFADEMLTGRRAKQVAPITRPRRQRSQTTLGTKGVLMRQEDRGRGHQEILDDQAWPEGLHSPQQLAQQHLIREETSCSRQY